MKKTMILIILNIILLPLIVLAGGSSDDSGVDRGEMITATCTYHNQHTVRGRGGEAATIDEFIVFEFSGIDGTTYQSSGGDVALTVLQYKKGKNTSTNKTPSGAMKYIGNYNKSSDKYTVTVAQTNVYEANNSSNEQLKKAAKDGLFCPSTVYYKSDSVNGQKYYFCDGVVDPIGDTCKTIENSLGDYKTKSVLVDNTAISNVGTNDYSDTDVEDVYYEENQELQDLCDPESPNYNLEKCLAQQTIVDAVVDQAADQGISRETLNAYVPDTLKPDLDNLSTITDCESLLGSPSTKPSGSTPGSPAYYMMFVFNIIKYIAIILLVTLSIVDFVKAVAAKDDDSIKKASNTTIKRLILCIAIFLLPTLIEVLLEYVHTSAIDTCGIN